MLAISCAAALLGAWLHDTVVEPEGWVDTLGDLIEDDGVAAEVAAILTDRVVASAVDELVDIPLLPGSVEERVEAEIRSRVAPVVARIVRSEAAETAWRTAIERSHPSVVALLRDETTAVVGDRTIRIDLAPLAERIVDSVAGALSDAVSIGGLDVDLRPDLDLDLYVRLLDLRSADTALDVASTAERHRTAWTVVALASLVLVVALGPHRRRWTAVAGVTIVATATLTRPALGSVEPDGLVETWQQVSSSADPYIWRTVGVGAALVVVTAVLRVVQR